MDEPRHAVWEGRGPAGSRALIEDGSRRSTAARWTRFDYHNEYDQPGGILGRMASRVLVQGAAEREAGRSLQKLKALLEDRSRWTMTCDGPSCGIASMRHVAAAGSRKPAVVIRPGSASQTSPPAAVRRGSSASSCSPLRAS